MRRAERRMNIPYSTFYTPHSKRDGHGDLRAVPWLAGDGELPSDGLQPLAHIVQPVSSRTNGSEVKADAIVRDADMEPPRRRRQFDLDFRRGGVFYGIVERFFEREEELVPSLGRNDAARQLVRELQPETNGSVLQEVIGGLGEVFDQALQGVVLGIDCPDNLIERLSHLPGRGRDLAHAGLQFPRRAVLSLIAEESEIGRAGAQIIMDVLGDAGAFPLDRLFPFQRSELSFQVPYGEIADRAGQASSDYDSR